MKNLLANPLFIILAGFVLIPAVLAVLLAVFIMAFGTPNTPL